jgi:hypothetical protein
MQKLPAMFVVLAAFNAAPASSDPVDVAIVLAIDVSSSVDPATAILQRDGHAKALEAPEVVAAIQRGYVGCIAITYFEWSINGKKRSILPWSRLCNARDCRNAATVIRFEGAERGFGKRTSLSFAINYSGSLLGGLAAPKKVIDISGNGENNDASNIYLAREQALAKGYVINAIVSSGDRGLQRYFAEKIIGGPGAFVMPVASPGDYPEALRRKLVQEIGGGNPAVIRSGFF